MKEKDIAPNLGNYGHLRWYDAPEIDDSRAALLGRVAALYAFGTGTRGAYSLEPLEEPRKRANLLRTVTNWVEVYPSKTVQRRLASLCIASPGVNATMLELEPFNADLLRWWYDWELSRQDARTLLLQTIAKVWPPMGKVEKAPLLALGFPEHNWRKIRTMEMMPSLDVERCLNQALNDTQKSFEICDRPQCEDFLELLDYYNQPEKKAIQEAFAKAWKAEEARLLAMPPKARDKEYLEQGV